MNPTASTDSTPASTPADAPTDATGEAGEIPTPICDAEDARWNGNRHLRCPSAHAFLKLAKGMERTIATLRAECAGLREWLPIETAPRCVASGDRDNGRRPVLVTYSPHVGNHPPIAIARLTGEGWISGRRGTPLWFQPTHWMPLPSAASIAASRATEGK